MNQTLKLKQLLPHYSVAVIVTMLLFFNSINLNSLHAEEDNFFTEDILSDPIMKPFVETCSKQANQEGSGINTFSDCLLAGYQSLSNDQKQALREKYSYKEKEKGAPSLQVNSSKKESEFLKDGHFKTAVSPEYSATGKDKKLEKSPALKKMHDYLVDQLSKVLYKEEPKNNSIGAKRIVDHSVFYDLYHQQLSQNIITIMSSYCIEADPNQGYITFDDNLKREAMRKENIKSLEAYGVQNESIANKIWVDCIVNIERLCTRRGKPVGSGENQSTCNSNNTSVSTFDINKFETDQQNSENSSSITHGWRRGSCGRKDIETTFNKACLTINALKKTRSDLYATENIIDKINELKKESSPSLMGTSTANLEYYDPNTLKDGESTKDLTTITSGQVLDNFEIQMNEDRKKLKECEDSGVTDDCRKLMTQLAGDPEEIQRTYDEYVTRSKVHGERIHFDSTNPEAAAMNDEDLKRYLASEGRSDEQIKALSEEDIIKIKQELYDKYQAEIDGVKNSIKKEIELTKTREKDGYDEMAKLKNLNKKLDSLDGSARQLIHYNNIVAGYLKTLGPNQEEGEMNVRQLQREMADSAYQTGRIPTSKEGSLSKEELEENKKRISTIDANMPKDPRKDKKSQAATTIGVEKINESILRYSPFEAKEGQEQQADQNQ